MSEHPPPAPDWILGEDGHWKPPPFPAGGRPTAPPPPAASGPAPTPPPGGWAPPPGIPPTPPPGGWTLPPGGAPAWGPPPFPGPSSTGPSAGRVVAWVVGGVALAGVAVVGILAGAVILLGTTAEPEARFTPVGSSLPDDGDGAFTPIEDDPSFDDEPPYEEEDPLADPTAVVLDTVADDLSADDWFPTSEYHMGAEEPVASAQCAPEGWQTGALDRAIGTFGLPDGAGPGDPLTIVLVAYETDADARADLERARSTAYQACEVEQRQQIHRLEPDPEVTVLPEDPTAPGVAISMTETVGEGRTEYDHIIVVGRLRAQLDVCDCAGFDLQYLRWVAADVAAAMAEQQGLPVPG